MKSTSSESHATCRMPKTYPTAPDPCPENSISAAGISAEYFAQQNLSAIMHLIPSTMPVERDVDRRRPDSEVHRRNDITAHVLEHPGVVFDAITFGRALLQVG